MLGQAVAAAKQLLAQGAFAVLGAVAASVLQLGHNQLGKVFPGLGHDNAGEVEAVDFAHIHPALQRIGHLYGVADDGGVAAAQRELLQQLAPGGPAAFLCVLGGRLDGVALAEGDGLVQVVLGEIHPGAGGKVRQAPFGAGVGAVVGVFLARLGLGAAHHHGDADVDLQIVGASPCSHGGGAQFARGFARSFGAAGADEDAFAMLPGKLHAARRGARLEQHRRALWRGGAHVDGVGAVVGAFVRDGAHLVGQGVDAPGLVGDDGIVVPAAFPELVGQRQKIVGLVVALIVGG